MAVMEYPKLPPLKAQKCGPYCYLQTFKNEWVHGKSKPVKGCTKTVASIEGGGLEGRIIWKEEFLEKYPELRELEAYRCKKKRLEGKKRDSYTISYKAKDEMISLRQMLSTKVYLTGHTWVLNNILKDTPLAAALKKVFSQYNRSEKIVSLAFYMYLERTSAVEGYANFADLNRLPWQRPLKSGQCSKLFKSISEEEIDRFLKVLNAEIVRQEEANVGRINTYYALDSTSISTYAKSLSRADWGYNRDGDELKQINILMIVNQETGIPAYYRAFNGEVPDVSTVMFTLREFARLGLNREAIIVCDRGYSSITNVSRFLQTKTQFIMNMRTTFSMCRLLLLEHLQKLDSPDSYNLIVGQHVISITVPYSYTVNYKTDCKVRPPKENTTLYAHIYLDKGIKQQKADNLTKALAKVRDKMLAGLALNDGELKLAEKFFIKSTDDSGKLCVKMNTQKIAETLLMAGIRVLLSDTVNDPVEADRAYRARYQVEESFTDYKQRAGGRRVRTSTDRTTCGKVFTLFIAAAIATMLRFHISNCELKGEKLPVDSDREVLGKLKSLRATVWEDGMYYSEVVGKKRELLEALNIPMPTAERFSKEELLDMGAIDQESQEDDEILNTVDDLAVSLLDA